MRYTSTRDKNVDVSFEEALTSGYCKDGGLFVPRSLPRLDAATLRAWAKLEYPQLMQQILRLFIHPNEVSDAELRAVCESALSGFVNPSHAVSVVPLDTSFYVAELFHGPTYCFKDLGMRAVISLLSLFATKRHMSISLLVSTTGDTGPAAVQAVADVANPLLRIVVHYPHAQISDLQRRQLTTVQSDHVQVVAFEGGGDDMDQPIKNLLQSPPANSVWTGVNSYNIGRPATQVVHFVWTYLRVVEAEGLSIGEDLTESPRMDVILPTGVHGNVAAGFMAKKMGLPLRKLVTAVNANDITHQVIQTGAFHRAPAMKRTLSEAINIQVPYNFERLLYYLTDENYTQEHFNSARVTDDEMCAATQKILDQYGYLACPNTAVAFAAALELGYLGDGGGDATKNSNPKAIPSFTTTALLATASPCKFEHAVTVAVGQAAWATYFESDRFPSIAKKIMALPERPPTIYPASETLAASQLAWESLARQIVTELEERNKQ